MKRPSYAPHLQIYAWAARYCYGKKVTDYGCGTGHGLQIISHFAKAVVGWDISPNDTRIARKLQMGCSSKIETLDIEAAPLNTYPDTDVSLAFEFLEHIKDPHAFLDKIKGSLLICSVPHDYPHKLHLTNYKSEQDVIDLLHPHFPKIELMHWKDGSFLQNGSDIPDRYVAICSPKILNEIP